MPTELFPVATASGFVPYPSGTALHTALQSDDGDLSYGQWHRDYAGDGTLVLTGNMPEVPGIITGVFVRVTVRREGGTKGGISLRVGNGVSFGLISGSLVGTSYVFRSATYNRNPGSTVVAELQVRREDNDGDIRVTFAEFGVTWEEPPRPDAPTITSPVSGATVATATPTIAGTHNDPSGNPMTRAAIEVRRVVDNALMWSTDFAASGSTWSRTYAGTTLASGTYYKVRARTQSPNGWGAWSDYNTFRVLFNSPPKVTPVAPVDGAQVSTATPTFQWSYSDVDGDAQAHCQIQVRPVGGSTIWDTGQASSSSHSMVYGGPTLSSGAYYEWRVRVWDSKGAASSYSAWQTFHYVFGPDLPTNLAPTGLIGTLTPTVAGQYNQGTGDAEAGFYYEIRQAGITIYRSGLVTGNLATGQVYGTDNPSDTPSTPPALNWATSYEIRFRSRDVLGGESGWTAWQPFETATTPSSPTNLTPNGSITGDTTPTLAWQHNDPHNPQAEVEIELQVADTDEAVTGYEPKLLVQPEQFHEVTETLTDSPPTQYKWRVRTKGADGPGWSLWSEWATFTVAAAPVLSVLSPTPSQVVTAPGLVVEWEITGGGSGVQQSYRVRVYAEDQVTVVHDSEVTGGTAEQYAIPLGVLRNEGVYYVRVSVTDTLNLIADSGLIPITTSWTPPNTITGLFAQVIGDQADGIGAEQNPLPNIYLTWDESPEPGSSFLRYVIYRRIVGEDAWRQLAIITDRSLTSYNDYTVASDTLYEYIVIVVADVAGEDVESEPSAPAQAQVTIRSAFVHAHGEESAYAEFRAETQNVDLDQDIAYVQPRRSRAPVAHVGGRLAGVFDLTVTDAWDRDLWRRVRALQEAQARGRVLMLRQYRDLCAYVVLESAQRSDQTTLMGLQLRFREVEAPEE